MGMPFQTFQSFKQFNPLLHPPRQPEGDPFFGGRGGGKRGRLERSVAIERLERLEPSYVTKEYSHVFTR
jgi:hypothetical protein